MTYHTVPYMVLHGIALHLMILHSLACHCIVSYGVAGYCIVGFGARAVSRKTPTYFIKMTSQTKLKRTVQMGVPNYGNWLYLGLLVFKCLENTRKGQSKVTKLYSFAWNSIFQVDIFFHPGYPTSSPIKWLRTSRPFNEEQRWHGRKSIFNLTAFSVPPCDNNGTCWIRPSPNTHVLCLQDILVEAPPGHFVNQKQPPM